MEEILDHIIRNKKKLYIIREDQLLLYIRGEEKIGKSYIIHVLEMGFTLLDRKNELMLSISIGYAAKDIRRNIVYITLSINTYNVKSLSINVNMI